MNNHEAPLTLKEQKEQFVTGHTGTTTLELLLVCISAPIGLFLFCELKSCLSRRCSWGGGCIADAPTAYFGSLVAVEALVVLLPLSVCQTDLLYPYGVGLLVCELSLAFLLRTIRRLISKPASNGTVESSSTPSTQGCVTQYRSTVSYLTFVAILAVDFTIFPRSFAKTETYGYGLMDLGAGSFVVSAGLVSWYAKLKPSADPPPGWRKIQKAVQRTLPLTGMGLLRLWTTKGLDYQEHVSEYGVHWNFFFTLGVVGVVSTVVRMGCVRWGGGVGGVLWLGGLVGYQWLLLSSVGTGGDANWQQYIEDAPRQCDGGYNDLLSSACNIFAANREGILGSVGYLIMYLASEEIGRFCLRPSPVPREENFDTDYRQGQRLCITTLAFWTLHYLSSSVLGIVVSRRSTNATFILWTIAHNTTILFLTWVALRLGGGTAQSTHTNVVDTTTQTTPIFGALNRHGLVVFILANLMTGAVNLSMNTLEASREMALVVIFGYLTAVGAVALSVDRVLTRLRRDKVD